MSKITIASLLAELSKYSKDGQRDARFLLADVLKKPTSYLISHANDAPTPKQIRQFKDGLSCLKQGVPLAYVVGSQPFWSLNFLVNEHTLIPRADTEILVEQALQVGDMLDKDGLGLRVLDLGTGSGVIAVCLKHERPTWSVTATDASLETLTVAKSNAQKNQVDIQFMLGDWFSALNSSCSHKTLPSMSDHATTSILDTRFHMIVANPPYIAADDTHLKNLGYEPVSALVSGNTGMADIQTIVSQAQAFLHEPGWLLIEHGYQQGSQVRACFTQHGFKRVATIKDHGNNERLTLGVLGG